APEGTALGVLLTHVELDEISGESGEVHDVGFGDRPASRCGRFTDRVVFEIHEGYDNAPGEWSSRRGAKTRRAAEASCYNRKFMRKKVTVVGGGNVGASCALSLAFKELADVVLVDVVPDVPMGKGLDMLQTGPIEGYDVRVTGANDYEPTVNSD